MEHLSYTADQLIFGVASGDVTSRNVRERVALLTHAEAKAWAIEQGGEQIAGYVEILDESRLKSLLTQSIIDKGRKQ